MSFHGKVRIVWMQEINGKDEQLSYEPPYQVLVPAVGDVLDLGVAPGLDEQIEACTRLPDFEVGDVSALYVRAVHWVFRHSDLLITVHCIRPRGEDDLPDVDPIARVNLGLAEEPSDQGVGLSGPVPEAIETPCILVSVKSYDQMQKGLEEAEKLIEEAEKMLTLSVVALEDCPDDYEVHLLTDGKKIRENQELRGRLRAFLGEEESDG